MPAFFTHYLFGRLEYERLSTGEVRSIISRQKPVYALGLAGPDIFFYFLPDVALGRKKTGSHMHEERCGMFLRNMLREAERMHGERREVALAYLAGFLGHYELDTHCHPYIYSYIGSEAERLEEAALNTGKETSVSNHQKTGIHFQYEAAMDNYFLRYYGNQRLTELNQNRITRMNGLQRRTVAELVAGAYNRTYPKGRLSIRYMQLVLASTRFVMWGIRDKHGRKEAVLAPVEKLCYGHVFAAGLLLNEHCYGIGWKEFRKLQPLFEQGRKEYALVLDALEKYLEAVETYKKCSNPDTSPEEKKRLRQQCEALQKALYEQIGSRSYHSGETV